MYGSCVQVCVTARKNSVNSLVVLLDKKIVSSKIYQSNFFLWSFYLFISDVVKHMLQ